MVAMTAVVRRILILAVAVLTVVVTSVGADAADAVAARSDKGVVAYGVVYDDRGAYPRAFQVQLVVPQGPTIASGLLSGVDLSRAWVVVSSDSADGNGKCSNIANPSQFSAGRDKGGHWAGLYVDVRCDDGAGYSFYRFTWASDWQLTTDPLITTKTGGQPIRFWADTVSGVTQAKPDVEQMGAVTACGYRANRPPDCFASGSGLIVVSGTGVTTTATAL
jgi:hypothetical protein